MQERNSRCGRPQHVGCKFGISLGVAGRRMSNPRIEPEGFTVGESQSGVQTAVSWTHLDVLFGVGHKVGIGGIVSCVSNR